MIVDILLIVTAFGAVISGFKRGFLQALFTTVGYIGGGVLGLILSLHYVEKIHSTTNKFVLVILAILISAEVCKHIAGALARFFRARLLWSPLRFLDSLAGVALELCRVTIISYLVLSVALGSPWNMAKSAVSESRIYKQMVLREPKVMDQLREEINSKLSIIPQY
jgi:uncharacterized membrane protein required for colicin V production